MSPKTNNGYFWFHRNTINKAVDYIVKNLAGTEDAYAIAICSYALHLAQHPVKDVAFNLLESKAHNEGMFRIY
jgi:A-macroglobulin complement component.